MTELLRHIWRMVSQVRRGDETTDEDRDHVEKEQHAEEDYGLNITEEECEALNFVCDWIKDHEKDKAKYGFWTSVDVNDLERCAHQRRVQNMYIEEETEVKSKYIVAFIEKILTISREIPKAPARESGWLNIVCDLKWQSHKSGYAADYFAKKLEKLSDDDEMIEVKKYMAVCQRFFIGFPDRIEKLDQRIDRRKLAQRNTSETRACARKAIDDILTSKCNSAFLNYSPRVYPIKEHRKGPYSLEVIDPTCELAFILREVKEGLENRNYYVNSLCYPQEDGWYSAIHARLEDNNDRAVRLKNGVAADVASADAKEEVRKKRLQESVDNLKDDIEFFTQDHSSDPFCVMKTKCRMRSFLSTYEAVRSELDDNWSTKAKEVYERLQDQHSF